LAVLLLAAGTRRVPRLPRARRQRILLKGAPNAAGPPRRPPCPRTSPRICSGACLVLMPGRRQGSRFRTTASVVGYPGSPRSRWSRPAHPMSTKENGKSTDFSCRPLKPGSRPNRSPAPGQVGHTRRAQANRGQGGGHDHVPVRPRVSRSRASHNALRIPRGSGAASKEKLPRSDVGQQPFPPEVGHLPQTGSGTAPSRMPTGGSRVPGPAGGIVGARAQAVPISSDGGSPVRRESVPISRAHFQLPGA